MIDRPTTAIDYQPEFVELVRKTTLYVATKLGDLMDEITIVGGLVPSLLIQPGDDVEAHVGTRDLDVGFSLVVLEEQLYLELSSRLRQAGFVPDTNSSGHQTLQRWKLNNTSDTITLDFLIPPSSASDRGGQLCHIEGDFAAIIVPGLHLAFKDRRLVTLQGPTPGGGGNASRDVWVCGPGAFVVLKALAYENRSYDKDAYDLYYVLRNFGEGIEDVVECFQPLAQDEQAQRALLALKRDFSDIDDIGPRSVANFLGEADEELQRDVVGFVADLLRYVSLVDQG